nr:hypothetical protein [uncultured Draconibacterium sp.]
MASLALLKAARLFLSVAYMFLTLFFVLLIVTQAFFNVAFVFLMAAGLFFILLAAFGLRHSLQNCASMGIILVVIDVIRKFMVRIIAQLLAGITFWVCFSNKECKETAALN